MKTDINIPERMHISFKTHQNILSAIREHNEANGIKFMKEHLDNARQNILRFYKKENKIEKDPKTRALSRND
jgi:DNA-binding GntR family transcriptional regulator